MREPEGFREYVEARSPALMRAAWLLTGSEATAQDLVQTALVRMWPRWSKVQRAGAVDAYVRWVLMTTYIDGRRHRWHAEVPTAVLPDATTSDPHGQAELRMSVRRALTELPPRQRAVVVLRYFEDLTEAQTAEALGCTVGTVKSQAAKALAKLRSNPWLATPDETEEDHVRR